MFAPFCLPQKDGYRQGRSSGFPSAAGSLPGVMSHLSGTRGLQLFPFAGEGYSGGTAPDFHGIPY